MTNRYPGYDVLAKRDSPSWNAQTRKVIDERLAIDPDAHRFFNDSEWLTLKAICSRIVPQPADREHPVPLAAMVDAKMDADSRDGFRLAQLPKMQRVWRTGARRDRSGSAGAASRAVSCANAGAAGRVAQ